MNLKLLMAATLSTALLSGCATWSTSHVEPASAGTATKATMTPAVQKSAADVIVTEGDISDRKYESLGDISVTVNKTTIFHSDPTREMVNEKLREEAAALGADAVVLVRYGTAGISLVSWGSLDGKGRAVRFTQ